MKNYQEFNESAADAVAAFKATMPKGIFHDTTKKPKPPSKEEIAQKAKNFAANRNNNVGQMDHSKRND